MNGDRAFMRLIEKLGRESATMSKSPTKSWSSMIHKVHPSLRSINKKEYEPVLVSIGPYHHGRENLQEMEKYKLRMLQSLLERTADRVENYISCMREIEEEAHARYASDIKMDGDEFVEMMILDGCFILEFLRQVRHINREPVFNTNREPVFNTTVLLPSIFRDLVLFENQLPLFVLSKLFELTKGEDEKFEDLISLVRSICYWYTGRTEEPAEHSYQINNSPHLLDLVYMISKDCILKEETPVCSQDSPEVPEKVEKFDPRNLKSATTLEETGVRFEKAKQGAKLRDINFEDGVLTIPQLEINDITESLFRNLVAYEQYIEKYDFTEYLVFMDYLINTPKDAELLRHRGIIVSMLGDDEYVSNMFNKIYAFVVCDISSPKFVYLCRMINKYSEDRVHSWMAKLWREYFNSPWTLISFLAALLLLGFTIVQTVFTIISYTNPNNL